MKLKTLNQRQFFLSWFFDNVNKIDACLARIMKKKRENTN